MNQILTHHHKYGDYHYMANNEKQELKSFKKIFISLQDFQAYVDLDEPDSDSDPKMLELYDKAKKGDLEAIRDLLQMRSGLGYEYEEITRETVE